MHAEKFSLDFGPQGEPNLHNVCLILESKYPV